MKSVDTLIHARHVLTMNDAQPVLEFHTVVIDDGRIIDILPQNQTQERYQSDDNQRLDTHCVMPGLINNHGHSAMTLFRGLADDLPLMQWLNDHIWPAEQQFVGDKFVEAGSALAIAEMLRGGTTCFSDMYFFPEATARVVDESGIRASLGMVVIEFPTNWAQDVNEYLHKGQAMYDQYRHHPLLSFNYAPHAPYTVADSTLERIIVNAEELDVPIQMHIHETAAEVDDSIKNLGMRPLARLKDIGLLSPRLIAVHMTQLTEEELVACSENGVHIVHCPESNLKLASGFARVADMHAHNINVSLGTDGAASNNDLDMFAEMHQAALLAKGVAGDPSVIPAYQALKMATINAAQALGLDNEIGSLETGKAADMIAVDLSEVETQPYYDLTSQLVYATGRDKVTDLWVSGRQLLKHRQLTTMNLDHVLADARQWSNQIRAHA